MARFALLKYYITLNDCIHWNNTLSILLKKIKYNLLYLISHVGNTFIYKIIFIILNKFQ